MIKSREYVKVITFL